MVAVFYERLGFLAPRRTGCGWQEVAVIRPAHDA